MSSELELVETPREPQPREVLEAEGKGQLCSDQVSAKLMLRERHDSPDGQRKPLSMPKASTRIYTSSTACVSIEDEIGSLLRHGPF